ncbi:hypothetical protein P7C71_g5700, partial [Lecanoromycetidae sp. Uapishka_2]
MAAEQQLQALSDAISNAIGIAFDRYFGLKLQQQQPPKPQQSTPLQPPLQLQPTAKLRTPAGNVKSKGYTRDGKGQGQGQVLMAWSYWAA